MQEQPDPIQQYIDAAADLRAATREAHEALRDLNLAVKEAKELRSKLPGTAEAQIEKAVSTGLNEYAGTLTRAIETAETAIFRRFGKLEAILLGDEDKKKGGEDLEAQIRRLLARTSPAEREMLYTWARLILGS